MQFLRIAKGRIPRSLGRYFFVGVGTSLLDFVLFNIFVFVLHTGLIWGNVVSTTITMCVSFLINRSFVFASNVSSWRSFIGFVTVTLFTGWVFQGLVIVAATQVMEMGLGIDPRITNPVAKVTAMGVGALLNYLGYRFIFSQERQ